MLPNHVNEIPDMYTGYPLTDASGRSATWHLKEKDVIILLGKTPPQCRYFGYDISFHIAYIATDRVQRANRLTFCTSTRFTNYLYSRYSPEEFEPSPSLGPISGRACLPGVENERCEYFASLSDTVNLDRGLNLPDNPFNASFALVISPSDRATLLATRALVESGVPSNRISNYSVPGQNLSLGDNSSADTFVTLLRTAFYDDADDKKEFFSTIPFKLLRMELNLHEPSDLHAKFPFLTRETGIRTDGTAAGLSLDAMSKAVTKLSSLVLSYKTGGHLEEWDIFVSSLVSGEPATGDDCVALGQRCLADCPDTLYPFTIEVYDRGVLCDELLSAGNGSEIADDGVICGSVKRGLLTSDNDDTMFVVGVNHKAANMSAYSSLAM